MLKRDFFLMALHNGCHLERRWVLSVFAETLDPPASPSLGDVVKTGQGYEAYVRDHESDDENALRRIELVDTFPGQGPLFYWLELFELAPGEVENHPEGDVLKTTYGNLLTNHLTLVIPFGDRIPFQTGIISFSKIESMIESQLTDNPVPDHNEAGPPGSIYVREYLQFTEHALSLVAYNSIAVQSITEKSLTGHPQRYEMRDRLREKYKGRLTDPAIIAEIGKALEQLDRDWLKDDPTGKFYDVDDGKYYGKVRKRLYYMFGGESPFSDGTTMTFIERSLEEGIVPEDLPVLINSLRFGSFNRGAQTQLGGEATKTVYRMVGTSRITENDCGSRLGIPFPITVGNYREYINYHAIEGGKSKPITDELARSYVGKILTVRSPQTCKTEGRNVCAKCMGDAMAELSEGLAATAAQTSGRFLSAFLAAMHGKELKTRRLDITHWLR